MESIALDKIRLGRRGVVRDLGEPVVIGSRVIDRPAGYGPSQSFALTIRLDSETEEGFGDGEFAREKAFSEAVERCALKVFCKAVRKAESSSGWAAHTSPEAAIEAALLESIERHSALLTWESGGPFYLVPEAFWPDTLQEWSADGNQQIEFFRPLVLLSSTQDGASVSVLLVNAEGGCVAGHASAYNLGDAISSAAREAMRAAHSALRFDFFADVIQLHSGTCHQSIQPGAHSLAYAYGVPLPPEVRIQSVSENKIIRIWNEHQLALKVLRDCETLDVTMFSAGDRFVARVKHRRLRRIYWGQSIDGTIKNKFPHFVG